MELTYIKIFDNIDFKRFDVSFWIIIFWCFLHRNKKGKKGRWSNERLVWKIFITYFTQKRWVRSLIRSEWLSIYRTYSTKRDYINLWSYKLKLHIKIPIGVWN